MMDIPAGATKWSEAYPVVSFMILHSKWKPVLALDEDLKNK